MSTITVQTIIDHPVKDTNVMLIEEALARSRMREAEQAAQEYRQARRLAAARTWQRLAQWAANQAARASDEL
jgi:hypothetical protein